MRYAFIINPASGLGKGAAALLKKIEDLEKYDNRDIRHYLTAAEGDAIRLADSIADEAASQGEEVRVYACGGDGTANEVANGLVGHDNAYLGIIPVGSGNDFVRNFAKPENFKDVAKQTWARPKDIDILEFSYEKDGAKVSRKYINGVNIGFDGNTAILAHDLKQLPGVSGGFSYVLALVSNLIKKKGEDLRVVADGEEIHNGPLLLCTVANGGFCGGGFNSCPGAVVDDGLAELLIVKDITRKKFLQMVPHFKAGKLFEIEGVEEMAKYIKAKNVIVEPNNGSMKFVADGEIFETGKIEIRLISSAVKLLIP